jgi:transposase
MKVMVFAGISHEFKSSLVAVEPGSIDAIAYVDDFVDGSGIIPNMNGRYGMKQWTYMQDGASVHRAESTMAYLTTMVNVLDGWPAGSPDLNPIENLWDVLKMRVEKEKPLTREGFIDVIMAAWDNLAMDLVNKLVASMPRRIRKLCEKQGGRLDY